MAKVALVCGAGGFVGGHAVAAFRGAGWSVCGAGRGMNRQAVSLYSDVPIVQGDFATRSFVEDLLSEVRPDCIVFAAGPSDVQRSFEDPMHDFESQVLPLFQVLDSARKLTQKPRFILVSSAAIYGNPKCVPITEDAQLNPISPYGFHKLHQERLLDEFAALYGLPTCKARVFSTYGPGLRHLAVWEIARRALRGDGRIRGSGQESRDYLHIGDVARALEKIATNSDFHGDAFNVASGVEVTIEQLSREIHQALGSATAPTFDGQELAGSPIRWQADIGALSALGFVQKIPLAVGIAETVDWIRQSA